MQRIGRDVFNDGTWVGSIGAATVLSIVDSVTVLS
jgi:hypothetical protein